MASLLVHASCLSFFSNGCDLFKMDGFLTGFLAGLALMLLIVLVIHWSMRGSGTCRSIRISEGENGEFTISSSAIRSFVHRIVADYPQLDLNSMVLKNTRNGLILNLTLNVLPETDLVEIRKSLRDKIYADLESKLGIAEQIKMVVIEVEGFDAKPENIAKHNRAIMGKNAGKQMDEEDEA